jgi:hypothetical protein
MLVACQIKAQQVKVMNLVQPYAFTFSATNQDVIVQFKNTGAVDLTSVDFGMSFNGFGVIYNTWNGTLTPGNSTNFNIGLMGINGGTNTLQVTVGAVNGIAYTDTADYVLQTTSGAIAIPFMDNLEGVANFGSSGNNWTSGLNPNSWQLAIPNYGSITPAGTPTSWVLGLDSGYSNNLQTYLYSPIFNFAASGITSIWFHFTANANLGSNDNLTVEYTTDFLTWIPLPAVTISGNTGGWGGYGTGLSFLAAQPQVQLRFVFNSDNSGTADGIAIDDISVSQCFISMINVNQLAPVSCAGACDAVVEAVPQIGYPPFTYYWSTGETTQSISNLCAGTYDVTITDNNGCSGQSGITLNQPSPITFNLGPDVTICNGNSAQLCANVFGGTPPFVYIWNTGAITSCITVSTNGVYSLTIQDAAGCSYTDDVIVTVNPTPTPAISGINSICNGGSAMLDAGFGYANYQWSDGTTTQITFISTLGIYTVTVTDVNGCTGSASTTISLSPPIIITPHEVFNCITLNDSVYVTATGGVGGGYTYLWSNGNTLNFAFLTPGNYTVTVTDNNGCTASAVVTASSSLQLNISKSDPVCYGYTGSLTASINGKPPFTYQWNNGVTVPTLVNASAGIYTVTVTDVNGCSLSATDSLVEPEQIILMLDSVIPSGCGASNGSFYYSFTPPGFSIPNINGSPFALPTNLAAGIYDMYILQNTCASNAIHVVVPDSCVDVWPGDANYDLVADNKDLLQIGLAYGNTGPVRTSASSVWVAQPATDWSNWFNIGVNQKHADCDGNGVIDAADTLPILANYGLTHLLKPANILQINTLAPDLYLTISNDTTGLSDSVFINVMCGTVANPIDSIYGLAFRLYYDSALVDTSSVSFNNSTTFLGTNGVNLISINKNFGAGYADFAITRTDHVNASGHGPITVMGIVTTDNVAGKMMNPVNTVLQFSLGNVYAITANENPITLDAFGDSIYVDSNLTAIHYLNWDTAIKVYPNPANGYLIVESNHTEISKITIVNQLGEGVYQNAKPVLPQLIYTDTLKNGIYVLRIETKHGVMYRKIQIIR